MAASGRKDNRGFRGSGMDFADGRQHGHLKKFIYLFTARMLTLTSDF